MKTKTINVYEYKELSAPAKEKALQKWREQNEYFYLSGHLSNMLYEYLADNKIVKLEVTKDPKIYYSLACCQGDGVMFEGDFVWKKYNIKIKHSGRYYHSNSKTIDIYGQDGLVIYDHDNYEEIYNKFEKIYQDICKKLEKDGYQFIEDDDSEENFILDCEGNERLFNSDGTINNL